MTSEVTTDNVLSMAVDSTSENIFRVLALAVRIRFLVLVLLIQVHLDNLVPPDRDDGVIAATVADVADLAFLRVVAVQVVGVDARINVENLQLALVRAYD